MKRGRTSKDLQYSAALLMAMQQKYREVFDGVAPPGQQEQEQPDGAAAAAAQVTAVAAQGGAGPAAAAVPAVPGGGGGGVHADALAPTPKDDFILALVRAACTTEGEKVVVFSEVRGVKAYGLYNLLFHTCNQCKHATSVNTNALLRTHDTAMCSAACRAWLSCNNVLLSPFPLTPACCLPLVAAIQYNHSITHHTSVHVS